MGLLPQPLQSDGLPRLVEYIGEIMELLSRHNITQLSQEVVEKVIRAVIFPISHLNLTPAYANSTSITVA